MGLSDRSLTMLILLPGILAGCRASGDFPSLALRDVETQSMSEPVRTAPVVADNNQLRSALARFVRSARQSQLEFERAADVAQGSAAQAGAPGSDSWIAAQEQVSRAEAARAGTSRALVDLDQLMLERSNLATSPGDQAELQATIDEVRHLASRQQARIDQLRSLIAR